VCVEVVDGVRVGEGAGKEVCVVMVLIRQGLLICSQLERWCLYKAWFKLNCL
jgi:hypothetical protein